MAKEGVSIAQPESSVSGPPRDSQPLSEAQVWRLIVRTIGLLIVAGLVGWFAWVVREVLVLLVVAGVLAAGLSPIVDAISGEAPPRHRFRLPRALAVLLLYLGLVVFVGLFIAGVVPPIVHQAEEFVRAVPGYADQVQPVLIQLQSDYPALAGLDARLLDQLQQSIGALTSQAGRLLQFALGVVGGLLDLLLLMVLTFYLSVDGARIRKLLIQFLPPERRPHAALVFQRMGAKAGGWLLGQLVLSLIIGVMTFVGLTLIGVPYAVLLAVVAAIGEVIPMLGPVIAAVPGVIVAAFVSPLHGVLALGLYVLVQQLENNLVVPQVMRRTVDLPPVVVIVALLLGAEAMGVVGAILAVPLAAMLSVLVAEAIGTAGETTDDKVTLK